MKIRLLLIVLLTILARPANAQSNDEYSRNTMAKIADVQARKEAMKLESGKIVRQPTVSIYELSSDVSQCAAGAGDSDIVYVGNLDSNVILALRDLNGDGRADSANRFAELGAQDYVAEISPLKDRDNTVFVSTFGSRLFRLTDQASLNFGAEMTEYEGLASGDALLALTSDRVLLGNPGTNKVLDFYVDAQKAVIGASNSLPKIPRIISSTQGQGRAYFLDDRGFITAVPLNAAFGHPNWRESQIYAKINNAVALTVDENGRLFILAAPYYYYENGEQQERKSSIWEINDAFGSVIAYGSDGLLNVGFGGETGIAAANGNIYVITEDRSNESGWRGDQIIQYRYETPSRRTDLVKVNRSTVFFSSQFAGRSTLSGLAVKK